MIAFLLSHVMLYNLFFVGVHLLTVLFPSCGQTLCMMFLSWMLLPALFLKSILFHNLVKFGSLLQLQCLRQARDCCRPSFN